MMRKYFKLMIFLLPRVKAKLQLCRLGTSRDSLAGFYSTEQQYSNFKYLDIFVVNIVHSLVLFYASHYFGLNCKLMTRPKAKGFFFFLSR